MTKRTRKTVAAPVAASEVIVQGNDPVNEQNTDESTSDTVEQSDELQAMIDAEDNVPESTDEPASEPETQPEEPVADEQTGEGTESQGTDPEVVAPAEAPEPEVAAAPVDPFADLPMTKIEDYEFRDLTDAVGNDPFKYEAVHKAAVESKLPIKPNWKHSTSMIVLGQKKGEFKPGSVYGTIQQIVQQYGRAGVPAYVLVPKVRQAQIGNKRSKYCTALPPIGWAEGWIDTFISKNFGKKMEKVAPPITAELVAEVKADDIKAEKEADRIAA